MFTFKVSHFNDEQLWNDVLLFFLLHITIVCCCRVRSLIQKICNHLSFKWIHEEDNHANMRGEKRNECKQLGREEKTRWFVRKFLCCQFSIHSNIFFIYPFFFFGYKLTIWKLNWILIFPPQITHTHHVSAT